VTVSKKLSAATFGLGSIDQADPFQLSMIGCGRKFPPPPPPNGPREPTAQHCTELTQETLLRIPEGEPPGTEADISIHVVPFQCCNRNPDAIPLESVVAPDAQQSAASTHVTP
jgi:hypothetical protein